MSIVGTVGTTAGAVARFADLHLAEPVLRAVEAEGYSVPTPIQAKAIPHVLAGSDLMGCAQTGTGKTAAFALPILHRLGRASDNRGPRRVRVLVLSPTRELASQIVDSFATYGRHLNLRHAVIFGGVNENPQIRALRAGVDILVATPGRLLDLMNQGHVDFRAVEVLVLDEADRMLDMGFIHDVRRIIARVPADRQTLMFSATMPNEIRRLADTILRKPVTVEVTPVSSTAQRIEQSVYFVDKRNKPTLLAHLLNSTAIERALVFTRTKHGADRVVRHLYKVGIRAEAIHGNKSQNARERALGGFKSGKTPVLVATDIAARGIDVDGISHVFNYDLSNEPEAYVHRIGRTARAGASGVAIAFCDQEERPYLQAIERLIRKSVPVKADHPTYAVVAGGGHEAREERREARRESRGEGRRESRHNTRDAGRTGHGGHPQARTHGPAAHHAPARHPQRPARGDHQPAARPAAHRQPQVTTGRGVVEQPRASHPLHGDRTNQFRGRKPVRKLGRRFR